MDQQQIFIKMALGTWDLQISRLEKVLSGFTDEQLLKEIAPGKNRVIYLMGHLIAYHDLLPETMGVGTRSYQHLDKAFMKNPDKTGVDMPDAAYLRNAWVDVHTKLKDIFNSLSADEWFKKHNSVNDEDFSKDPARNRLNMLINRAVHVAYHAGQIRLI